MIKIKFRYRIKTLLNQILFYIIFYNRYYPDTDNTKNDNMSYFFVILNFY